MRAVDSPKILALALIGSCIASLSVFPADAVAQTRAALVRDIDTPALQPVRYSTTLQLTSLNRQAQLTTVPTGKRLVIDQISWSGQNSGAAQIVFAALRSSEFGTLQHYFPITAPHASVSSGFTLQDGATPVHLYFEAGEEVWITVTGNTTGSLFSLVLQGHLINP